MYFIEDVHKSYPKIDCENVIIEIISSSPKGQCFQPKPDIPPPPVLFYLYSFINTVHFRYD